MLNEKRKKLRKTYLTINSNDRNKKNKIVSERNVINVDNNGIEIISKTELLIKHTNHNYDVNEVTEIIFRNIVGTYDNSINKYTLGGIPVEYLNYNDETGKPIFTPNFIYEYENGLVKYNEITNKIVSNSYKINLNLNLNTVEVGVVGGGNNIIVERVKKYINGYEDSSYYKIDLPRVFKNIRQIKMISLEMNNSQYTIRNKVKKENNNLNDYILNNNYIYWINRDDLTNVNSKFFVNNEKVMYLLNNKKENIPINWIYNKKNEKLLYEHLSDTYLTKINTNVKILGYNFIEFLYSLKKQIINPITNVLTVTDISKLSEGYLVGFSYEEKIYKLYLKERNNILSDDYYIDDFYDDNKLIDFIYKYTNFSRITNTYDNNLVTNFENNINDIDNAVVNIYGYLKNISQNLNLEYSLLNNNIIKFSYVYIKKLFIDEVIKLMNEISEYEYNNNDLNNDLIKCQYEFINYLENLRDILIKPFEETIVNLLLNSYIVRFDNNNKTYTLFIKERPNDNVNNEDIFLDDLKDLNKFLNFVELYTNYNPNDNSFNINSNFLNILEYTNNVIPVDIYGYLRNLTKTQNFNFNYNDNIVTYLFIKDEYLRIIKKTIENIIISNNNSYNLLKSKPNLLDQNYYTIPNNLKTDIYNVSNTLGKKNYMVETPQNYNDMLNIKYLLMDNCINYSMYPIYSVQIEEGNYTIDTLIDKMSDKLNQISRKKYDYFSKTFMEEKLWNIKIAFNSEVNKHNFVIDLDETSNLVKIYQYNILYSYSALDLTDANQSGPFVVNEGYPYLFVKHKNHKLHTGNIIKIEGASNIFNISSDSLNKHHYIFTHKIYRIYVRLMIPLESGEISDNINNSYYLEGNKFLEYSDFKSGINKIYRSNETKKHIGTNSKVLEADYDISKYELMLGKTNLDVLNQNVVGRVINFSKDEQTNNYIIDYALLSDINFNMGMIFKTSSTNTFFMIIPSTWSEDYLPKLKDLNNEDIIEIKNVTEGYSIKTLITPNKTSLSGIGGLNINIKEPVEYSLLFNKNDTLHDTIGFENKETDFNIVHSNTYKNNKFIIDYSYLEPTFNDTKYDSKRFLMIKTLTPHDYNVGDIIYVNNHLLNSSLIYKNMCISLNIIQYEPFCSYYNNLSIQYQKIIEESLTSTVLDNYKKKGVVIYYNSPYNKKHIEDLGNLGMSIRKYNKIDYFNYKEVPYPNIYNLNKNSYVYINQNQKTINKIKNNIKSVYKTGLRDGYYKVLNNIPILNNSYYNNYFNNTNSAIIEVNYTTLNDYDALRTLNYSEVTQTNSTKYTENILEGYLNNGEIITSNIDTKILGNNDCDYNNFKIKLNKKIDSKTLEVFYPINKTNNYYINYINNNYTLNNDIIKTINIYRNINYKFDISNNNLLSKIFTISNLQNSYNQYSLNNNIEIIGTPGLLNSYIKINVDTYENVSKLYININNQNILELNILNFEEIKYNVSENNNEFIFENLNEVHNNLCLKIDFGKKYILQFNQISYENFKIVTYNNYNNSVNNNYIIYDNINYKITILITDNNYEMELYYHYKNINKILGKFILGIFNYYNKSKGLLINSIYIDNINEKIINESDKKHVDLNIINNVNIIDDYKFKINLKNDCNLNFIDFYIIPYYNYNFLYENCKKNQKVIKLKVMYELLDIIGTNNNYIILNESNYNLNINDKVIILNNLSNTNIIANSRYYIIEISDDYKQIKLGYLNNKSLVIINKNNKYELNSIKCKIITDYEYKKQELLNKSLKINYLQSYSNLTNKIYNENISIINNNISLVNISNNAYYNMVSNNLKIIDNQDLINLKWTSPYGSIRFSLEENNIINYININYSELNNNSVKKVHLYYIENGINNYIGLIQDINVNNILNNSYNKKDYIIYFESNGLFNNIYSELEIPNLVVGYKNNINNILENLTDKLKNIKIDNIINKYSVPISHLDDNIINETNSLLLNNNKSSIIDLILDEPISLKYYKIVECVSNNSIIIDNQTYNKYYEYSKITSIQLFAANNINFTDEIEIIAARYSDNSSDVKDEIIMSFNNSDKYQFYRFKLISNLDYYPYNNTNINNSNDISRYNFNTSIAGIVVGTLDIVNYSDLYIEDVNYIENVLDINEEFVSLELKYNLLNSHLSGENVVLSDSKVSLNNFTTQNLIIFNNWYTRIFYKGYDSIYNYYKNSKTYSKKYLEYNSITELILHGKSKYIIKNNNYVDIYILNINTNVNESITSTIENQNKYSIKRTIYLIDKIYYTEFTIDIPYYINHFSNNSDYNIIITDNISNSNSYKNVIIKDSYMNEGLPMIQEYLRNDIFIENMNGFYIPEINFENNDNQIKVNNNNRVITSLLDNSYETYTYEYMDLVFKSDMEALNNTRDDMRKNGIPIYGHYKNNIWNDEFNNKLEYYTNYYSITLKGKYMGFSGVINNKIKNSNNILNKNVDGFEVIDISYDNNNMKNGLKLNLQLESLGINIPENYMGNIDNIKNKTIKNNYIIGYGGDIFQKKVYKNISDINNQKYIYMSINKLNNILNTNRIKYFSKILLTQNSGSHLYDTFAESEIIYDNDILDELSELEIKFINDEGKLFNLEGSEHSFMLEILEEEYDF